ncbi:hypothetical protein ASPSYDRAFT_30488 [Aspergillus sydowii CBS 593.65]|uniref:Uncharacterized protein n=1 Tax=Aspergillus sydowii CBS 593.65 TaxID=1036612 RepID=A0A1L9TJS4_9EURO|nr:uncharacterized protein ASPSYDRAFT_30488 [Aspergillus sydowii CBS 593.65]OJJ59631.1 hypothetical protein ASPSYDRAFT_30488 [Aspergillus sydowii CBS 593.65]
MEVAPSQAPGPRQYTPSTEPALRPRIYPNKPQWPQPPTLQTPRDRVKQYLPMLSKEADDEAFESFLHIRFADPNAGVTHRENADIYLTAGIIQSLVLRQVVPGGTSIGATEVHVPQLWIAARTAMAVGHCPSPHHLPCKQCLLPPPLWQPGRLDGPYPHPSTAAAAVDKAAEFRALRDEYKLRNPFEAPPPKTVEDYKKLSDNISICIRFAFVTGEWVEFALTCYHRTIPNDKELERYSEKDAQVFSEWKRHGVHIKDQNASNLLTINSLTQRDIKDNISGLERLFPGRLLGKNNFIELSGKELRQVDRM